MRAMKLMVVGVVGLAFASMGCEDSARERLRGTWEGELIMGVPHQDVSAATGWVRATQFNFDGNRATVTIPAETPRTGRYTLAEIDESHLRITFQRPEGGEDVADFAFEGEDRMRWTLDDKRYVILRKVDNS